MDPTRTNMEDAALIAALPVRARELLHDAACDFANARANLDDMGRVP